MSEEGARFDEELVVVEPNVALGVSLLVAAVVGVALNLTWKHWEGAVTGGHFGTLSMLLVVVPGLTAGMALAFAWRVWFARWRGHARAAHVSVSTAGVFVDGKLRVSAEDVRSARPLLSDGRPAVRLVGRGLVPIFEARVRNVGDGARFLDALGHGVGRRKRAFRAQYEPWLAALASLAYLSLVLAVVLLVAEMFASSVWIAPAGAVAQLPLLLALRGAPLEIGADGILVRWPWRSQWIAFDAVRTIERRGGHVRFVLAEGHVDVRISSHAGSGYAADQGESLVEGFMASAREALAAHRGRTGPRVLAETLRRGTRDRDAWVGELRALRDGHAGYRASAVRVDDLWRVVEDPSAPEDARAAAAFVLKRDGEEAHAARERLRVTAEAVASPKLRVALATDDEASLAAFAEEPAAIAGR